MHAQNTLFTPKRTLKVLTLACMQADTSEYHYVDKGSILSHYAFNTESSATDTVAVGCILGAN